jgi:hypothetical protein
MIYRFSLFNLILSKSSNTSKRYVDPNALYGFDMWYSLVHSVLRLLIGININQVKFILKTSEDIR